MQILSSWRPGSPEDTSMPLFSVLLIFGGVRLTTTPVLVARACTCCFPSITKRRRTALRLRSPCCARAMKPRDRECTATTGTSGLPGQLTSLRFIRPHRSAIASVIWTAVPVPVSTRCSRNTETAHTFVLLKTFDIPLVLPTRNKNKNDVGTGVELATSNCG